MAIRIFTMLIAGVFVAVSASSQTIEWRVTTDRLAYWMGELVTFSTEACNLGTTAEVVNINVAPEVVDSDGDPVYTFFLNPWVINVEIPPGECASAADQVWDQQDIFASPPVDQVPPGWYRGELFGTYSAPFEIRARAAVPLSPGASVLLILGLGVSGLMLLRGRLPGPAAKAATK